MKTLSLFHSTLACSMMLCAPVALAQHEQHSPPASNASPQSKAPAAESAPTGARSAAPYPLGTCPITGKKLGSMGEASRKVFDGREVRFCCAMCEPKFEKNLAASFTKLDAAIIKDQGPLYPLTTSVVSGKDLPAKPYDFVYENRLVRLVAEGEKAAFLQDPKKFLAALDVAAISAQDASYPLTKCAVSDEDLGGAMGEAINIVVGGRLIKLCCADCKADVEKDPVKYILLIDQARKNAPDTPGAGSEKKDAHSEHKHGDH